MSSDTCIYTFRDGRRCTNRIKDSGHCSKHVKVFRLRRAERGEWIIGLPVDATMVKRHLRRLHEAGIGTRRIAELAGITGVTVRVIRNKDQERVHPNTAARILAVPLPDVPHADCVADSALITAVGTQRRLRALVALGHTQEQICVHLGIEPNAFSRVMLHQSTVTAQFARRVAAVYQQLQMQPGPSLHARRRAAEAGWPPPLAWDDETIDFPDAQPHIEKCRRQTFIEKYWEYRELGYNDPEICHKLRFKDIHNFYDVLYKHGVQPRRPEHQVAS